MVQPLVQSMTTDDFILLWKKVVPVGYSGPIISYRLSGSGYETFAALAAMASRLSLVGERIDEDLHALTATGGAQAQVTLVFSRPAGVTLPALSVESGTLVATPNGEVFIVREGESVSWAPGAGGDKLVNAVSVVKSYQANVFSDSLTNILFLAPLNQDPRGLTVTNPFEAVGGRPASLDALAANRGLERRTGETDASLRKRYLSLCDIVTPAAVRRQIARSLAPHAVTGLYVPGYEVGAAFDDACLDDPKKDIHRYMTGRYHGAGHFFVVVGEKLAPGQNNGYIDDDAFDDVAFDQTSKTHEAVYGALKEDLERKVAAGISFDIVLDPST